ncbi:MAG: putative lipid II flippase FtsW [Calditrichaceae bacterium]
MRAGKLDLWIAVSVTFLLMIGMVMVFSASSMVANTNYGSLTYFFKRQLTWGLISIVLILVFSKIDYRRYKNHYFPVTVIFISIILLMGLFLFGKEINGARRWYDLGIITFQPSEFAKLAVIGFFAYVISEKGEKLKNFSNGLLPPLTILGMVIILILLEPNLSTALMILMIVGLMLLLSQAKIRHLLAMAMAAIPAVIYMLSTHSYQMLRVVNWLKGITNPLGADYQVRQSLIGIGRGGFFGNGIGASKQKFFFLPDSHTDFIFSIIGEEFGFIGTSVVLIIFLVILYRGIRIAIKVPDDFGKFLAVGLTLNIVLYAFVNAAVVTHLFPATGLPMPFISYGGTHLAFMGVNVGILLNISRHANGGAGQKNWSDFSDKRKDFYQTVIST